MKRSKLQRRFDALTAEVEALKIKVTSASPDEMRALLERSAEVLKELSAALGTLHLKALDLTAGTTVC
jgi:hypothetical protein